ncbi:MAG TPA: hypothetical protein H9774_08865 [Candidatus Desulfovibrio gallistercoris]|nr:hypothetical protein [Candidatus Desulfovibrio gallistercoris]
MPSPLELRVEVLERQVADMQAMLESLLAHAQRQQADASPAGQSAHEEDKILRAVPRR